jgi:hypothetical protein
LTNIVCTCYFLLFFFILQNNNVMTPVIIENDRGSYQVRCDNQLILLTAEERFTNALEAWMACYWVLSIAYPKRLANTLQLLERGLLGHGTGRVTATVNQWASRLGVGAINK